MTSGDPLRTFKHISTFMPRKISSSKGHFIQKSNGDPNTSISGHKFAFREYLANLMDGSVLPFSQHLEKHRQAIVKGEHIPFHM